MLSKRRGLFPSPCRARGRGPAGQIEESPAFACYNACLLRLELAGRLSMTFPISKAFPPLPYLPGIEPGRFCNSEFYISKPGAKASEPPAFVMLTVPSVLTYTKEVELLRRGERSHQ